jgi:acyl carrier protein
VVELQEILGLVRLQLGVREVKASDHLVADLGAESIDIANLIATLEARYGIKVKESEIPSLVKVSDLFELVHHRQL